jgi:hypothetical protein
MLRLDTSGLTEQVRETLTLLKLSPGRSTSDVA